MLSPEDLGINPNEKQYSDELVDFFQHEHTTVANSEQTKCKQCETTQHENDKNKQTRDDKEKQLRDKFKHDYFK